MTSDEAYIFMQEESKLKPILILFTNSSQSISIISYFEDFSINFQNKHQIDFAHIDCLKTNFCTSQVQVNEFPSVYLMQGPNYFYWKKIMITNLESEINNFMNFNEPELVSDKHQLSNSLQKIKKGGSHFHLTIQQNFKTVFKFFCNHLKYFRIFHSSFTYSLDENIQAATISCFYSENCFFERRIRPIEIESFFEDNKFSFYHLYQPNELKIYIETSPFVFVVFQNDSLLASYQDKIFLKFNEFCSKFKFGFIDSKINENFLKAFSIENKSRPFIFAINIFNDCYKTFQIDANRTEYENVLNGTNCQIIGRKFRLIPRKPKKAFSMISFALSFGAIFALFYCIATSKRDDPFLERQYDHFRSQKVRSDDLQTSKHAKND